jgi:exosome complex RNA-binding protein Csl4
MAQGFVTPGERLGIEEEFATGENTYVENGILYSAVTGIMQAKDGALSVRPVGREIKKIGKEMLVLGSVVGDMKSVIFVKIDNINTDNKEYIASKDGKIVVRRPMEGGGRFHHGRDSRGPSMHGPAHEESRPERPCGIGDIIIANVQYNDKDSYALSLNSRETGVVYSHCSVCGGEMLPDSGSVLECKLCKHREMRKVSPLYNKPEEIKKLFE